MFIASQRLDYEGELGAVIGRVAANVGKNAAPEYVAGYFVFGARPLYPSGVAACLAISLRLGDQIALAGAGYRRCHRRRTTSRDTTVDGISLRSLI